MRCIRQFLLVLALVNVLFFGAVGFHPAWAASKNAGMPMTGKSQDAMSTGMGAPKVASQPAGDGPALDISGAQHFTVYLLPGGSGLGFTGPDKAHHDTVVPSSFVLRKGVPVTFTVINLDDMSHSITAPGLEVNIMVKPGIDRKNGSVAPSRTTYTFTPRKAGEFRWFCIVPCDMPTHWAMTASYDGPDRDGFMAGIMRVL
jgi:hypothetical protein